jgi:hypothetical protein
MSVLKRTDPASLHHAQIVGYVNHHTGVILCFDHGERDIESPRSPWCAVRLADDGLQARYTSTVPVICHECGAWLNDESTGYAIVSTHDGYWKRRLRHSRGDRLDVAVGRRMNGQGGAGRRSERPISR